MKNAQRIPTACQAAPLRRPQPVRPEESRLQRVLPGAIYGPKWHIRFGIGISLAAVFGFTNPSILKRVALGAALVHDSASLGKPTNLGAGLGEARIRRIQVESRRNKAF